MPFYPDATNLIAAVRTAFMQQILPALPPGAKYDGLMVANALGIIERELAANNQDHDELQRIARLLARAERGTYSDPASLTRLDAAQYALSAAIRAGAFDAAPATAAVVEHLMRGLTQALQVDNPRALQKASEN